MFRLAGHIRSHHIEKDPAQTKYPDITKAHLSALHRYALSVHSLYPYTVRLSLKHILTISRILWLFNTIKSDLLPLFDLFYNLHLPTNWWFHPDIVIGGMNRFSFSHISTICTIHPHIVIGRMNGRILHFWVHVLSPAIDPTGVPIAGGFITWTTWQIHGYISRCSASAYEHSYPPKKGG